MVHYIYGSNWNKITNEVLILGNLVTNIKSLNSSSIWMLALLKVDNI
jgi:hypothetical protein